MASIIPVFIPHEGCPHSCVFCNQHSISGQAGPSVDAEAVKRTIATWLARMKGKKDKGHSIEVAFYGGSFTGLPLERQEMLLGAVSFFLKTDQVKSIRVSTRPDYIDIARLTLLATHQVRTVELGVQSLDDQVLQQAVRGHSCEDVHQAVGMLKEQSFSVGMQLMVGLPGQSFLSLRQTVHQTLSLQPDFVRIYPVLVVAGSRLAHLYEQGEYQPLSLETAVFQTAYMKKQFEQKGIKVIRMGLQAGASLESSLVAGPYHPAFGEMVYARIMLRQTRHLLAKQPECDDLQLVINKKDMSIFRGVGNANMYRLSELGLLDRFSLVTDEAQPRYQIVAVSR